MAIGILSIIFTFIIIIVIADNRHEEKMRKMKIEAAMREAEMQHGYAPGTYSRTFSSKKEYKAFEKEMKKRRKKGNFQEEYRPHGDREEREALEKGIEDLEKRIENLNIILNEKRRKKENE